jgi:pantoate--beta-alanine ligase
MPTSSGEPLVRHDCMMPQLITSCEEVYKTAFGARYAGQSVGLVPTMGALHEGHLALLDAARAECDFTVTSIFVNPTQFAPAEDLRSYPRNLDRDLALLGDRGCDVVFAPSELEVYRSNHDTYVDVGRAGQILEGEFRPTHFRGVATIVMKLFQIIPATHAYFGRKDYQQTIAIRQMVADLNVPIDVRVCPTVREANGLAMSSRNAYLSVDERRRASVLSHSLRLAEKLAKEGERDAKEIRQQMLAAIEEAGGFNVQYIAFVADDTLTPVDRIEGPTTVALAATLGKSRLIDNILIGGK